jgi:hypothetical protein
MEMPRLHKSIRRVVKLQTDEDGTIVPTVIYRAGSRKRKISSGLQPIERVVRRLARSQVKMADTYLKKHTRSNQKRKDGFLKDFISNVTNAGTKGRKALGKNSMRWPSLIKMN